MIEDVLHIRDFAPAGRVGLLRREARAERVQNDREPLWRGERGRRHVGGQRGRTMSLHVGQQVVCINDTFSPCEYWRAAVQSLPVLHGIYTIRHMREAHGLLGLCFYEIRSPHAHFSEGYVEPAFNSQKFRPVKRTSIEIFEKLLAPVDQFEGV
jgi:hypothetical protein